MKALRFFLQPWTDTALQTELLLGVRLSLKSFTLQVSKRTFVTKNRNGTFYINRLSSINRCRIWKENGIIIITSERTRTSVPSWRKRSRPSNRTSVPSCLTWTLFLNVRWKTTIVLSDFVTEAANARLLFLLMGKGGTDANT